MTRRTTAIEYWEEVLALARSEARVQVKILQVQVLLSILTQPAGTSGFFDPLHGFSLKRQEQQM